MSSNNDLKASSAVKTGPIPTTIKLEGRFRSTTRLSEAEQALLHEEGKYLEKLWADAQQSFAHDYELSQQTPDPQQPTLGSAVGGLFDGLPEFTGLHLKLPMLHAQAVRHLDDAAEAGITSCKRVAEILFRVYGGEGVLEVSHSAAMDHIPQRNGPSPRVRIIHRAPHTRGLKVVHTEDYAWMITQTVDRVTFSTAWTAHRRLKLLLNHNMERITPHQKRMFISDALSPFLLDLANRTPSKDPSA